MKRKTSLKDIAQEAGVSTALVSYVLNNKKEGRINKAVAQKIRDIARHLNYRTNQIARSLKTRRTNTIGLIVADISNHFSSSLARIIEDEADKYGYTVLFGSSDESEHKFCKILDTLVTRQVDGLIMAPPINAEEQIRQLQQQQIPFVLFDRYYPGFNCNYVVLDNFDAVYQGMKYLIGRGRQKTGMITYGIDLFHLQERKRGFVSALKDCGIQFQASRLKEVSIHHPAHEIEQAFEELLSAEGGIDSILFASNSIALAGLKYLRNYDIVIPEQLEILSFDETESMDLFYAPISFIKQPMQQMGQEATRLLLEQMDNPASTKELILRAEIGNPTDF